MTHARLPPLREDFRLFSGPSMPNGTPTWSLYDPAAHRYLRIGWEEFEILSRWGRGSCDDIAQAVNRETTLKINPEDVEQMLRFAERSQLLMPISDHAIKSLAEDPRLQAQAPVMWLLKNYLFFRLRLLNPDRFLARILSHIRWVFSREFLMILLLFAVTGFAVIARQWESFIHSFLFNFSLNDAVIVGCALMIAKIVHEFGHGLVAKRFGCNVPAMGVAFLVLWPVLWTDTTDAWRLTDRKKRLLIDSAGILAEMTLAVIASLAWSILPEGSLRTAAFLLASSTWILTLLVNINPLMRFDGYFLLSDLIDVPNLQERAFAMARWQLRELLFRFGEAPPEKLAHPLKSLLLAYAYATWIYRVGLFFGIALLVYHFTFWLLGLVLMSVEIGWFIVLPIIRELGSWRQRLQKATGLMPRCRAGLLAFALTAVFAIPWRGHVEAPALRRAGHEAILYTETAGQLTDIIPNGSHVQAGDIIAHLSSPEVDYHLALGQAEAAGLQHMAAGQSFDLAETASLRVHEQDLDRAEATWDEAKTEAGKLVVHAPFAGILIDQPPIFRPGTWLAAHESLGILVTPQSQIIEAFVNETDIERIHAGASAEFIPESNEESTHYIITDINPTSSRELEIPELASIFGGGVAVRKTESGKLIPVSAIYKITLESDHDPKTIANKQRGIVEIMADRESLVHKVIQKTLALFIREWDVGR